MEYQSIEVSFDIFSYTGDWFNTLLYLEGIASLCSVWYRSIRHESVFTEGICELQAGMRCDTTVRIVIHWFHISGMRAAQAPSS